MKKWLEWLWFGFNIMKSFSGIVFLNAFILTVFFKVNTDIAQLLVIGLIGWGIILIESLITTIVKGRIL